MQTEVFYNTMWYPAMLDEPWPNWSRPQIR
jgi:hypothetical protein